SFAGHGYTNRQAARCSPQTLGERGREAAQQTGRTQRESSSSSEDCWLDEGGREGPQQTGGSCGTSSSREPSKACRARAGCSNCLQHRQNSLQSPTAPCAPRAPEGRLLRLALFLAGHLVLQRKRADCGIASPVIAALCGQNADRQSEHERGGGDDYTFGHHGSPLSF